MIAAFALTTASLTVFAAASLKDAFESVADAFESREPGVKVVFSFAGSQTLAAQVKNGARADVLATASMKTMSVASPYTAVPTLFATNKLTLVLAKDREGVSTVRELSKVTKIVLAGESVPAGEYADEFLAKAAKAYGNFWLNKVRGHIVSREPDVRSVLAKVALGEADAGVVYQTDAWSARTRVKEVLIPDRFNVVADYPVAVVLDSRNKPVAKRFISFLVSSSGRQVLSRFGFGSSRARRK